MTTAPDCSPAAASEKESALPKQLSITFVLFLAFAFVGFARPEDVWPFIGSFRLTMVFSVSAGVALLAALFTRKAQFRGSGELALVLLLTLWFIAGVPFAFWRGGSFNVLTEKWVRTLLFFVLATQTLTTVRRVEKAIWVILLSELFASAASLILPSALSLDEGGRMVGINKGLLGWNFLGITVSVTLPFISYLYVSRRSAIRTILLAAVIGSTMWMLVLTASRGGMMGIVLSIVLSWWFILRGSSRGRLVTILMGVVLVVGVIKAPPVFWERMATMWNDQAAKSNDTAASAEESTEGRRLLLIRSIQATVEHPIFGLGLGNFGAYNTSGASETAWHGTHNTFTQISSESGIPGLLLFVALFVVMIRHTREVATAIPNPCVGADLPLLARAAMVSTISFIFSGFFAHIAYEYLLYFVAGISAALWTLNQGTDEPALEPAPQHFPGVLGGGKYQVPGPGRRTP
jgi:putative inorganic carbon (hco3(-)) transporter